MFTVCPKCALTLVVTAADLRVAQGYVRCGRCSNVFNALARLSEDRQAAPAAAQAQASQEDASKPAPRRRSDPRRPGPSAYGLRRIRHPAAGRGSRTCRHLRNRANRRTLLQRQRCAKRRSRRHPNQSATTTIRSQRKISNSTRRDRPQQGLRRAATQPAVHCCHRHVQGDPPRSAGHGARGRARDACE